MFFWQYIKGFLLASNKNRPYNKKSCPRAKHQVRERKGIGPHFIQWWADDDDGGKVKLEVNEWMDQAQIRARASTLMMKKRTKRKEEEKTR